MEIIDLTTKDLLNINAGGIVEGTCDPLHEQILQALKGGN